jgi:hypothetical protein
MPKGIKSLRWLKTGSKVYQLEADRCRLFEGCVYVCGPVESSNWAWYCYAGQGEAPTLAEAKAKVESFVSPLYRYRQGTTWGDNKYALFELHPMDGAVVRAAGSAQHCDHFYKRMRENDPERKLLLHIVRVKVRTNVYDD